MSDYEMPVYSARRTNEDILPNTNLVEKVTRKIDNALQNKIEQDIKNISFSDKEEEE